MDDEGDGPYLLRKSSVGPPTKDVEKVQTSFQRRISSEKTGVS